MAINKLSKNFKTMDYARQFKHTTKNFHKCRHHPEELEKYFAFTNLLFLSSIFSILFNFSLYCENCKVMFCAFCIIDHPGHQFKERKTSGSLMRPKLDGFAQENKAEVGTFEAAFG